MGLAHVTETLALGVDLLLFAASLVMLLRWRSPLAWVTCLVAADPLWADALVGTVGRHLPPLPPVQAIYTAAADAPLWVALVVGFRLLSSRAWGRGRA